MLYERKDQSEMKFFGNQKQKLPYFGGLKTCFSQMKIMVNHDKIHNYGESHQNS